MKEFCLSAALFLAILIGLTAGLEAGLASLNANGRWVIGRDVRQAILAANVPHPQARTLYLGDSVARQLFTPESEPSPEVLYLPSNQAASVAGQFKILERAMANCQNVRQVYLFYRPRSWENNLDQCYTNDYFCGHFHEPSMIWQVWQLKHDRQLLETHLARMLVPNLMAANSWINQAWGYWDLKPQQKADLTGSGKEPTILGDEPIKPPSDVSRYYLEQMRKLCLARGAKLIVLPSPCFGSQKKFAPAAFIYDSPIRLYDPALFRDDSHLKDENIAPVRQQFSAEFKLGDQRTPSAPAPSAD